MAKFTTRVELHGATEEDYEILHEAMEAGGFSRRIAGESGRTYHLPEAEYNLVAELTAQSVLESAKRAAETTGREYSVLVTEGERRWHGLQRV